MPELSVTQRDGAVRFTVRVQPRASRSAIEGLHGTALRVRLQAPPVDGAANEALVDLLAKSLGVARRQLSIVAGTSSRIKVVDAAGVDAATVRDLARR